MPQASGAHCGLERLQRTGILRIDARKPLHVLHLAVGTPLQPSGLLRSHERSAGGRVALCCVEEVVARLGAFRAEGVLAARTRREEAMGPVRIAPRHTARHAAWHAARCGSQRTVSGHTAHTPTVTHASSHTCRHTPPRAATRRHAPSWVSGGLTRDHGVVKCDTHRRLMPQAVRCEPLS